jgi:hypothetical protein
LTVCAAVWRPHEVPAWLAGAGLAGMWIWTGIAYHGMSFSTINQAAIAFGVLFVGQGLLFAGAAARAGLRFTTTSRQTAQGAAGWTLIAYAMLLYPLLGWLIGMSYPAMPTFGITPSPVTLFTVGVLLLADRPPWWLAPIPLAWSVVGTSAAALLGVPQDWALVASAVGAVTLWAAKMVAPKVR